VNIAFLQQPGTNSTLPRKGPNVPTRKEVETWNATLTVQELGPPDGEVIVVLHSEEGPAANGPLITALSTSARVYAVALPGFDGSTRVPGVDRPHEIAYVYLDVLDRLNIEGCALVGSSLGGWIGLEMAAMQPARFSALALIGPLGVRFGERTEPNFSEILVADPAVIRKTLYRDPDRDPWGGLTEAADVVRRAEQRESLLHYTWEPYMHNPKLVGLLGRIDVSTLILAGDSDSFVVAGYYDKLAAQLPVARVQIIGDAGHFPEIEQPTATVEAIDGFLRGCTSGQSSTKQAKGLLS
jgi:pimeloyl-ACP methyl ester carboxylesterase